ncbi:metallopeptidase TldD-related protein [Peptoniphilaceae bacterium AMB_02]|nr:metallopeptidase TldD-related protein [Peptoniphilaceae bacterium AMB_02]
MYNFIRLPTYMHNGEAKFENIISSTELGVLAIEFGGANIDWNTGNFVINIKKGILVKDGIYVGYIKIFCIPMIFLDRWTSFSTKYHKTN